MAATRRTFRGTCVVLLAGLMLSASNTPFPAAEPAVPSHLDWISPDCGGFVTIRVADLLDISGAKDGADSRPWLAEMSLPGLSPTDVERVTFVFLPDSNEPGMIVQGTKPLPKKAILTFEKATREVEGKEWYATPTGEILFFASDRLLVKGRRTFGQMRPGDEKSATPQSFTDAVALMGKHDIVAWVRPPLLPQEFPLRKLGIESATLTLDAGKQIVAELRALYSDDTRATQLGKSLRGLVDLMRGQLTLVSALPEVSDLFPDGQDFKEFRSLPLNLMRQAEKGLQRAVVQSDGANVKLTVSLPMDAKTVRMEIESRASLFSDKASGVGLPFPIFRQTWVRSTTLPSPRYLNHPPQYIGPSGPFPTKDTPVPGTGTLLLPPDPRALTAEELERLSRLPVPALPAPPPPRSTIRQASVEMPPPMPTVTKTTAVLKLTVANIRKEPALLFEMAKDGKLTFLQKLPPGEAVDLKTATDKRWVAVFADKPAGESFDPKDDAVWLLR